MQVLAGCLQSRWKVRLQAHRLLRSKDAMKLLSDRLPTSSVLSITKVDESIEETSRCTKKMEYVSSCSHQSMQYKTLVYTPLHVAIGSPEPSAPTSPAPLITLSSLDSLAPTCFSSSHRPRLSRYLPLDPSPLIVASIALFSAHFLI